MSLFDLIGAANELANLVNQPVLTVDAKRCVHTKNKSSTCQTCLDRCPVNAISLDNHQIVFDASRCVQCGHCLHTCPTGTFTGVDGVEKLLDSVKQLPHGQVIEIACPHHPHQNSRLPNVQHKLISTRCLAAYSLSTYVSLQTLGVKKVVLRLDSCSQCPLAELQLPIMQTAEQANALLSDREQLIVPVTQVTEADIRERPAQRTADQAVSRRALFQMFRKPLDKPAAEVSNEPEIVPLGETSFNERIPLERVRLIRALRQLGNNVHQGTFTPFRGLKAGTDCTACGICAFACPTRALEIEWGEKQFALNFTSGACTGCALCTELCPVKALALDELVPVQEAVNMQPKAIISGLLQRCRKCNAPFATAEPTELCPLCEYHQLFPFGHSMKAERNHG